MASTLAQATATAHKAVTSLLSASQVTPGSTISTSVGIKETAPDKTFTLEGISGKNIIVGVPGAFTGTCNQHVPGYIQAYDQFKAKGVNEIYVVAVNDVFVVKAWKEHLAPSGTGVRFISDDSGSFVGSLGLLFDPSALLGGPRAKRFVLVVEGTEITHVAIEPDPTKVTVTGADKILPLL
ncbi:Redoxin [Cristinia sonorae]|uniref:Redoxin n=1 Tax=Cristinia sonorae TaxID=1940300 RepID=A0A8K0XTD3_9AGAR|nr:Redoxin [Cristinia sonorae]